jgi:hypothetical protein
LGFAGSRKSEREHEDERRREFGGNTAKHHLRNLIIARVHQRPACLMETPECAGFVRKTH